MTWSVREVVRFYREFGFFGTGDLDATVKQLVAECTHAHRRPPDPGNRWDDVFLLAFDQQRVWIGDPEADVCMENQVYTEVLPEWGKVSLGAFAPQHLEKVWESDKGPIVVQFELEGQSCSTTPHYDDDWIDMNVLGQLNSLLRGKGKRFEYAKDGNFAVVFVLHEGERERIAQVRVFPFALKPA